MTTPAIDVQRLTHRFGELTALDNVALTVRRGEVYGFLGRNGAGKTTLIRAMLGLIQPTSGAVSLLGTPVRGGSTPAELWARVGYLVEGPGLYPTLTVLDHLGMAARYRSLPRSSVDEAIELFDLCQYAAVPARALSLGNRQRLGLALAMAHRPDVLILDEPVNGLDPSGVVEIRDLLRRLADSGVTVFMSTHIIGEVARLADRVGIIHRGRLVEELPAERLGALGEERLVATFRTPASAERAATVLVDAGIPARTDQLSVVSTAAAAVDHSDQVVTCLVEARVPPISLTVRHEDLEAHFLRLTSGGRS